MKIDELFLHDFADESFKENKKDKIAIKNIQENGAKVIYVDVKDSNNKFQKQIGTYITIECENDHDNSKIIAKYLKEILKKNKLKKSSHVLIVGLGNDSYLSDALGPKVIKEINVTSHLPKNNYEIEVSCFIPGVMAVTGLESSMMIKSLIDKFNIDLLIVVDSLATKSISRLYRTYQITDTGLNPGSGINNNRLAINSKEMGIPTIAIGVATVVDTASLVINTLNLLDQSVTKKIKARDLYAILYYNDYNFVMTSKEIDSLIDVISYNIADAINLTLNPKLAINDTIR